MAFRHGSKAQITINSVDLSAFSDNLSLDLTPETADTTGFGSTWRTHLPGLIGASLSVSGSYDPTATTGPAAAITDCLAAQASAGYVAVVDKPGGTASGQRTSTFNAILSNYNETSTVDDKTTWSAELTITGAVTFTTQ